jgi:hypothetical protein
VRICLKKDKKSQRKDMAFSLSFINSSQYLITCPAYTGSFKKQTNKRTVLSIRSPR